MNLHMLLSFLLVFIMFLFSKDELIIKLLFLSFSLSLYMFFSYFFFYIDFSTMDFITYSYVFSEDYNLIVQMGIDIISVVFSLLTTFIFFVSGLMAWTTMKYKINLFFCLLLFLEVSMLNVFVNFEILFFYVWYESALIPIFIMILVWGNPDRKVIAAFYLMMYTLVFSVLFFFSMVYLHFKLGTTNMLLLKFYFKMSTGYQNMLFIPFFLAFAVKIPMFPIHVWLPEAHVEAPTVGSVILASLLLKLGYYGFLRMCLPYFTSAIYFYKPVISVICVMGCIYGSLLSLSQNDMKKLIAYSSVSHMSLCSLGLFSGNFFGMIGSFVMAMGHSFISSGLFYLVGVIYDSYHSSSIDYFSGLSAYMPNLSFFFFLFMISNFGFPISMNFVAEFFILVGVFKWNFYMLMMLIFYSVMSVAYNLLCFVKMFHGTMNTNFYSNKNFIDIQKHEILVLLPLCFWNSILFLFASKLLNMLTPVVLLYSIN